MPRQFKTFAALILVAWGGGCAEGENGVLSRGAATGSGGGWSQVRLPGASREAAFDAGVHAMKQWFRVESASRPDAQVRSAMTEYNQRGGTERIRDAALKFNNRMRRQASLVVLSEADGCIVKCRVNVQRLDTSDYRTFHGNDRFTDSPNETPIDTDAGVSSNQSEVWTDMPCDRQLAQDILSVVKARVTGPTTTSPAAGGS